MTVKTNSKQTNRTIGHILTGTSTVIVLAILVFIQLISLKHNGRYDLTQNKRFSLSEQSINVVKNLEAPVQGLCFFQEESPEFSMVKDLLNQYREQSEAFSFRFVDPDREPLIAEKYGVTSYQTIVLKFKDQHRKVTDSTEKAVTNGILKLTRGDQVKTIYFLTLHGELDIESMETQGMGTFKYALEDANFKVKTLNLLQEKSVPTDCTILVVCGPQQDPEDMELTAIGEYLDQGGNLAVMIEPQVTPKLAAFLAQYGVEINDDLILDPKGLQSFLQPVINTYTPHEITTNFDYGIILQGARSLTASAPAPEKMSVTVLASTNPESWGETDIYNKEISPEFNEGTDIAGPLNVAAAVEISHANDDADEAEKRSRILVFGDSDWLNNVLVQSVGNRIMGLNIFHWLAEEKDLIAIPPKDDLSQPLQLTQPQLAAAFWIPVILIPILIFGFGSVRIYERRRRS